MLDVSGKVWLLEINRSPDASHSTPVLQNLCKSAFHDFFDKLLGKYKKRHVERKFEGTEITNIPKWTLVHDQIEDVVSEDEFGKEQYDTFMNDLKKFLQCRLKEDTRAAYSENVLRSVSDEESTTKTRIQAYFDMFNTFICDEMQGNCNASHTIHTKNDVMDHEISHNELDDIESEHLSDGNISSSDDDDEL